MLYCVPLTRVFDSYAASRNAIRALIDAGVSSKSISVLTRSPNDAEVLNQDTGASDDLEDAAVEHHPLGDFIDWLGRVESVAVPGFGSVLGTGDVWLAHTGGRGSITGALVGVGVPVDQAEELERAVMAGRIVVVVHGRYDEAQAGRAFQSVRGAG